MDLLVELLAILRAAQMSHQTAHWTVKGPTFAGDHALFERIYGIFADQIDGLAEKMVQLHGEKSVDLCKSLALMSECVETWDKTADLYKRALAVENAVKDAIVHTRDKLAAAKKLPLGLDNFLAQLADEHDTPLYLLGQRNKGG